VNEQTDQRQVKRNGKQRIRIVLEVDVFLGSESVMEEDAKTKYVADGRGCHVQIQGEVTTEDFAADRAHHNGYFKNEAGAPNKEL